MSKPVEIVAEAAEGYWSDWGKELALVDLAAGAGADALKFQLLHPDELLTSDHPLYQQVESIQLLPERWRAIADRCSEMGISLYLDVFGSRGLQIASELGPAGIKVHSSDMLNHRFLREVAASPIERVLLSGGGTTEDELVAAAGLVAGKDIVVIQGFQAYPTPVGSNRIRRLVRLAELLPQAQLGFADHTGHDDAAGEWLPALAVALGATYVEKHITVAQVLRDPDHQSALNPDAFARFVRNIRSAETALGDSDEIAAMSEDESKYRSLMKKHVVAARDLPAGTSVSESDVTLKRSGDPPDDVILLPSEAVGRKTRVAVPKDRPLARRAIG